MLQQCCWKRKPIEAQVLQKLGENTVMPACAHHRRLAWQCITCKPLHLEVYKTGTGDQHVHTHLYPAYAGKHMLCYIASTLSQVCCGAIPSQALGPGRAMCKAHP